MIPQPAKREVQSPAIALLLPTRGRVTVETLVSTSHLDGIPTLVLPMARKGIVEARNALAESALRVPSRAGFLPSLGWYALWVDDDAFWPTGTIKRMLAALQQPGVDILAGWFGGRSPNASPKCFRSDGSFPRPGDGPNSDCRDGDVVEVSSTGFHFVMHRLGLLEEIGSSPFTLEGTQERGEDLAFCERARTLGKRIWVHTGCPVAHIADDGMAYLPGEPPMRVDGATLVRADRVRDYGDLEVS